MKKWISVFSMGMLAMSLAGCGAAQTETSVAKTTSESVETSQTPAAQATQENKTELSGKVVVYCPSPEGLADKLAEDFTGKTGVQVEMFQGTTGEILARLEAEKENPVADVVIMASWSDGLQMIKDDKVLSYKAKNSDKVQAGWIDGEDKIYGYSASAAGVIYNTTLFNKLDADWSELGSNSEYKDMIAIPDPLKSGSCKDFLAGFVDELGEDKANEIMKEWIDNGLAIPGANKAALESVLTGEKGILIAGVDYNAYSSISKGEPIDIYYPKSGTVINPRPAMILKTSQNLDNAKAFMDYLLSDDAQKLICDAYLLPGRNDIQSDVRTNVSDIPVFKTDWENMSKLSGDVADHLVNSTKK